MIATVGSEEVKRLDYRLASARFGTGSNGKPVISVARLRRATARREMRFERLGHRTVIFRPVDLDKWAAKFGVEPII